MPEVQGFDERKLMSYQSPENKVSDTTGTSLNPKSTKNRAKSRFLAREMSKDRVCIPADKFKNGALNKIEDKVNHIKKNHVLSKVTPEVTISIHKADKGYLNKVSPKGFITKKPLCSSPKVSSLRFI